MQEDIINATIFCENVEMLRFKFLLTGKKANEFESFFMTNSIERELWIKENCEEEKIIIDNIIIRKIKAL